MGNSILILIKMLIPDDSTKMIKNDIFLNLLGVGGAAFL